MSTVPDERLEQVIGQKANLGALQADLDQYCRKLAPRGMVSHVRHCDSSWKAPRYTYRIMSDDGLFYIGRE
jgi:hypothetical protein